MKRLQDHLRSVTDGRPRRELAELATELADAAFPDDELFVEEQHVRDVDTRLSAPPADGRLFRAVLAAAGVPLVEALTLLGYWPDLRLQRARSPAARVVEALRMIGYPDAEIVEVRGRHVTVRL